VATLSAKSLLLRTMASTQQSRAQEYRRRKQEARAKAEAATTAVIRKTQLDDSEMFERMAQSAEKATPGLGAFCRRDRSASNIR